MRYFLLPPSFLIAVAILRPPAAPVSPPVRKASLLSARVPSPALTAELPSLPRETVSLPPRSSTAIAEPAPRTTEELLRLQDAHIREMAEVREHVIRRMADLLELAYLAFDQKKFDRCIKVCDEILMIDPRYTVANELKEVSEKSRHSDGHLSLAAWKVEEWKQLTYDGEQAIIPQSQSVCIPSLEEWAEIRKRITEANIAAEGGFADTDQDGLAIERKLDTMKIDLAFENTKLEDILSFIREFSGLNLILDAEVCDRVPLDPIMSFRENGLILKHALRLLLSYVGLDYVVTEERVVLLTAPYRVPLMGRHR